MEEGNQQTASGRLAAYAAAHPGTDITPPLAGQHQHWYAWTPADGDDKSGEVTHGRTAEELAAKLGA